MISKFKNHLNILVANNKNLKISKFGFALVTKGYLPSLSKNLDVWWKESCPHIYD